MQQQQTTPNQVQSSTPPKVKCRISPESVELETEGVSEWETEALAASAFQQQRQQIEARARQSQFDQRLEQMRNEQTLILHALLISLLLVVAIASGVQLSRYVSTLMQDSPRYEAQPTDQQY